jgi:hypothetical protein
MEVGGLIAGSVRRSPARTFSVSVSVRKHDWPQLLRKAPSLPINFRVGVYGSGLDGVSGSVTGVTGHMGGASGMAGGPGDGTGRLFLGFASSSVAGNCGGPRRAALNLAARPGPRCFNGLARPFVLRVLFLEEGKHMLSAVRRPERK